MSVARYAAACIICPGFLPLLAFLLCRFLDVTLPQDLAARGFIFEAVAFYVFSLPCFIIARACKLRMPWLSASARCQPGPFGFSCYIYLQLIQSVLTRNLFYFQR